MQKYNLIDMFYPQFEYGIMSNGIHVLPYSATYQPASKYFENRFQAYPCWETDPFEENSIFYEITKKIIELKLNIKIKKLKSFFRKIYKNEINKSVFKDRIESLIHVDKDCDYAGVIYFNSLSINDGTRIYTDDCYIEPELIVGSKPNRLIMYPSNTWHSASIGKQFDVRYIQPIFIKLETKDEYAKS